MKHIKKIIAIIIAAVLICSFVACEYEPSDMDKTQQIGREMAASQSTPTDIEYSLQRYNLIRRAYWMNGYEEKARALPCEVDKPLGYIYLFLEGVGCVATYTVDGQITSTRAYLTPDTTSPNKEYSEWLPDVDGTYGDNQDAIFWFTVDGEYKEWNGVYHYSSTFHEIGDVMLTVKTEK